MGYFQGLIDPVGDLGAVCFSGDGPVLEKQSGTESRRPAVRQMDGGRLRQARAARLPLFSFDRDRKTVKYM